MWPAKPAFAPRDFVYSLIENSSFFFGWACLYVAMLYSHEVRQQERRLAAIREEALTAQMRALRYQINPHFLFNTFNSIAALIEEGMPNEAKRMVVVLVRIPADDTDAGSIQRCSSGPGNRAAAGLSGDRT